MDEARAWFRRQGLMRVRTGRWLAGICTGIARRYGVPIWAVRVAFVVLCVVPVPHFIPVVVYLALCFLMPSERDLPETY